LRAGQPASGPLAATELLTASVWQRPLVPDGAKERLAKRQANAAAALLRLGQPQPVWPLLRHAPDPRARSYLVHRLGPLGADARAVVQQLLAEPDVSARRALLLSLGEYTAEQLPAAERQPLVTRLLTWYRDDPDPGVHAAIDWLLRYGKEGDVPRALDWQQAEALAGMDAELAGKPPQGRHWYINPHGQTLAVLPLGPGPIEFLMGSPGAEPDRDEHEMLHYRRIARRFAIATKDVTVRQFQEFTKAHPELGHFYVQKYSPDDDGPIIDVTWYEAAAYCRWLSEQEHIPEEQMCYPSVAEIAKHKDGLTPLRLPLDYLWRTGYRLPTEAEWEYACRAGAATSRYYGEAEDLLPRYAWYTDNAHTRAWPVGQKKPNDFGLFDMHGNVWNWCQESGWDYKPGADGWASDSEDNRDIKDSLSRVLRGGAFINHASSVRSACRYNHRPTNRSVNVGLRPARTYR
jgi:formylglycine-generating enzyme required for sulfatase activity